MKLIMLISTINEKLMNILKTLGILSVGFGLSACSHMQQGSTGTNVAVKTKSFHNQRKVASTVATTANSCADQLKLRIEFAYNDGGLSIKEMLGPVVWSEGVMTNAGHPSLVSKIGYAVSYKEDPEVIPNGKEGKVFISANCTHNEPSEAVDINEDGIFNLLDTEIKGK